MNGYGYFPGCSLRGTGIAYEESLLELFRLLGVSLKELDDWNCCGATSYMSIDERSAFVLSARNLALAQKAQCHDLLAPCSACYLVLRKTQDYAARYPQIGNHVKASLSAAKLPALDGVRVRHPLEVLYTDIGIDRISARRARQWSGGRVACYYGCQLVRPYHEVDRSDNPSRLEELMRAVGVPTVRYSLSTKCCGGALTGTMHAIGVRLSYILLKEAARKGAQAMVTLCPLCQYNLDAYQAEMRRRTGEALDMPVLYFTQVVGWMLGGDAETLGIRRSISGRKFIRQWFAGEKAETKEYV